MDFTQNPKTPKPQKIHCMKNVFILQIINIRLPWFLRDFTLWKESSYSTSFLSASIFVIYAMGPKDAIINPVVYQLLKITEKIITSAIAWITRLKNVKG